MSRPWRDGFVFLDDQQRTYLVAPWQGTTKLLCYWLEDHWVILYEVSQYFEATFARRALGEEVKNMHADMHERWIARLRANQTQYCERCGAQLVFSARERGDGLCGPCSREPKR